MSTPEMGGRHQEYEFGHETIVNVTAQKIKEMEASNMPPKARYDNMADLKNNWDLVMEDIEKAQGN